MLRHLSPTHHVGNRHAILVMMLFRAALVMTLQVRKARAKLATCTEELSTIKSILLQLATPDPEPARQRISSQAQIRTSQRDINTRYEHKIQGCCGVAAKFTELRHHGVPRPQHHVENGANWMRILMLDRQWPKGCNNGSTDAIQVNASPAHTVIELPAARTMRRPVLQARELGSATLASRHLRS